jgi:hypothetical protein
VSNEASDEFQAALDLVHTCLIQKEEQKRSHVYQASSGHRSGIECLHFFMDFVNEVAGYTDKHYTERFQSSEELIKQYRE